MHCFLFFILFFSIKFSVSQGSNTLPWYMTYTKSFFSEFLGSSPYGQLLQNRQQAAYSPALGSFNNAAFFGRPNDNSALSGPSMSYPNWQVTHVPGDLSCGCTRPKCCCGPQCCPICRGGWEIKNIFRSNKMCSLSYFLSATQSHYTCLSGR